MLCVIKWGLICLLGFSNTCLTDTITKSELVSGKVVRVLDGDTYDLLLENKTTVRVRMEGIDAPETGMPYSRKATDYLKELTKGKTIKITLGNKDQYGRVLSYSYLEDGRELSREMIKAGFAWHYKQYNKDPEFAALEKEAKAAQRGLWQDNNPMAPWDVRRMWRNGESTKEMFVITKDNR